MAAAVLRALSLYIGLMSIAAPPSKAEVVLGTNGSSGLGLVPKADVLPRGTVTFDYSTAVPGHPSPEGYNYQAGAGLGEGLEVNFRLATQSNRCNAFIGQCPPNFIRDLAGSFKYLLPISPLKEYGITAAVGAIDVGGAATNFRSRYITATKSFANVDITAGAARGQSSNSYLDGPFGSIEYRPLHWYRVSLQHVHRQTSAHMVAMSDIPQSEAKAYFGFHRALTPSPVLPDQWFSVGLEVPMSTIPKKEVRQTAGSSRAVKPILLAEVPQALRSQGFYEVQVQAKANGLVQVVVNNTAYPHNILDAAGVALGVLAGLSTSEASEVELNVQQRSLNLLRINSDPACLRTWFESTAQPCDSLQIQSPIHEGEPTGRKVPPSGWWAGMLRPELIVSPAASYTIGTEVAALDAQVGVISNLVVPLWRGATFDVARIDPTSLRSREFERGGLLESNKFKAQVTRRMLHQLIDVPQLNTVVRISHGTGFVQWKGTHIDAITTSSGGTHRMGLIAGKFEGPPPYDPIFNLPIFGEPPQKRNYQLANYRYAWDDRQRMTTELVAGKFWGQDTGAQFTQRFWFGDSSIAAYYRSSRMPMTDKPVAFAGLLFTFPLTPRSTTGWKWGGVRGANNFALNVESKVGETDNRLTFGYGEIPRFGEGVAQFVNQDRYSGAYYRANTWRLRNAFRELTRDGD